MSRDISVGDAACNPYYALALLAASDKLHYPRLVGIGDRERLAARTVSVGVGQIDDDADRLACRACALQRDVNQRTVVYAAVGILQLVAAAEGGFGNDERMFVHVTHGRVCLCRLSYVAYVSSGVPLVHGHRPSRAARRHVVVETAVELVRVGRVADHDRRVGRGAARDDEVGACA